LQGRRRMTTARRARRDRRVVGIVLVVSVLVSIAVSPRIAPAGSPLWQSSLQGICNALLVASPILFFEVYVMQWPFGRRLLRLPLVAYLGTKMLYYIVVIVGGSLLTRLIFHILFDQRLELDSVLTNSLVFGSIMAVIGNLTFEMGGLLGWAPLKNLLTGRYVQPRREQRVFLLIDMKDSTGMAERLGPIAFHELLNDFFRDVADAALECEAEIHKYVGDEAILTWSNERAPTNGGCLECPFVARDLIEARRQHYLDRFGALPSFRAALHCGEIVAGEIGDLRREIAYVGDTLNVAARLLEAAKDLGHDILVSEDVLAAAPLPHDLKAETLPTLSVRGRVAPLGIAALARG
jgi:adenylate cyclase